jgi:hypothetical protein
MDLMYQTCSGCACVVGFFLGIVLRASMYNKWREREGNSGSRGRLEVPGPGGLDLVLLFTPTEYGSVVRSIHGV